jgi:hypothetical protein
MKEPNMTEPTDPAPTESFQPAAPEPAPLALDTTPGPAIGASSPVVPAKRSPARQARWVNAVLGLALAVAVAGVAFAAGRMTAPAPAAANGLGNGGRFFNNGGEFPGGGFGGANGGAGGRVLGGGGGASLEGTVTAVTADSITITTASGQSVTLATSGSTTYHQQASASASDVKTGGTVIVRLGARVPGASPSTAGQAGLSANDITVVP